VLPKLVDLALCRSIQLLAMLGRPRPAKDLEILVLRRQLPRPRLEPADRALLAAISRALPRAGWSHFMVTPDTLMVTPDTLLRWHRCMAAHTWTHPQRRL